MLGNLDWLAPGSAWSCVQIARVRGEAQTWSSDSSRFRPLPIQATGYATRLGSAKLSVSWVKDVRLMSTGICTSMVGLGKEPVSGEPWWNGRTSTKIKGSITGLSPSPATTNTGRQVMHVVKVCRP